MALRPRRLISALIFLLAAATVASACDVPVFRYALERWTPDPYEVLVFHRGPLPAAGQARLDRLTKAATETGGDANLVVRTVDLAGDVPAGLSALWAREKDAATPRVVVLYPRSHAGRRHVWSGPFNEATVAAILDSPVRTKIADRIIDGQTAVWILIEGGDKATDDAAEALLRKELALMPGRLSLPPELAEEMPHLASHLRIEFSVMRIGRTDPAEQVLSAMLLDSESDLQTTYAGDPVVFPVYGRGRTLPAMVGRGIMPGNILGGCRFLVGRCACEVKDENPGIDLLMKTPWKESLTVSLVDMIELPTPIGEGDTAPGGDRADNGNNGGSGALVRNVGMAIGFILVVTLVLVIRMGRKRHS
jgi:hypothetical protein